MARTKATPRAPNTRPLGGSGVKKPKKTLTVVKPGTPGIAGMQTKAHRGKEPHKLWTQQIEKGVKRPVNSKGQRIRQDGEVRKKPTARPGMAAKRQIKRLQKSVKQQTSYVGARRAIVSALMDVSSNSNIRISRGATDAATEIVESMFMDLVRDSLISMTRSGPRARRTLTEKDLDTSVFRVCQSRCRNYNFYLKYRQDLPTTVAAPRPIHSSH